MKRRMIYLMAAAGFLVVGVAGWAMAARATYESAEYEVVEQDGAIEIREYPDLWLASTTTKIDAQGRDGSFMRLFRYISGANEAEQKISMTTPVFMQGDRGEEDASMGFVLPMKVAEEGAPKPTAEGVEIQKRKGGRFAVIRFAGRLDTKLAREQEAKLRQWMASRDLEGEPDAEAAGYDPPYTPGPMRRNEVLIRLAAPEENETKPSEPPAETREPAEDSEPS